MHPPTLTVVALATLLTSCASEEHHKRAPSGFTGVRGKKSIPDSAYGEADAASEFAEKRAPAGFLGMRGKKPWESALPADVDKRAPSGFMGVRGKKEMEFANYGDDYDYKRAPSGFFGMRGKKEFDDRYDGPFEKRTPMGFMGMRGKKEYDDPAEEKRAPSGFFGMRGKKMPRQSGFFGMRGKKYPYEFRGKFVGVRGKKVSDEVAPQDYYSSLDWNGLGQDLDINQLMLLLTENGGEGGNAVGDYGRQ